MTADMALTLGIMLGALILFVWNRIRTDVVALMVMAALILGGLVTPREGVSGFANEATITIAAMFVLSSGLIRTGLIDYAGRRILALSKGSELRFLAAALIITMVSSAFINNTPVVVMMVAVSLGVARSMNLSPSRVFMPVSFASQLGGTLTLIGTSTNLLVSGILVEYGLPRLGMFQFTAPALILALIGYLYLLTVGRWLVPHRTTTGDLMSAYELRDYLSALSVEGASPLVGSSLGESRFETQYGLQVVGIDRGEERIAAPNASTVIHEGDVLLVRGKVHDLARISDATHLRLVSPSHLLEDSPGEKGAHLAEMIVLPHSPFAGRTLREARFRTRYGVPVLGIQRHGSALQEHIADLPLQPGDVLLVQGTGEQLMSMHNSTELALLGGVEVPPLRRRKLGIAALILVAVVALNALNVVTIVIASILGVIAMFLTGCLTPDEAYEDVDLMTLVTLGSMIPLSIAMQRSGLAQVIATGMLSVVEPLGTTGILMAMYLLTSLLTEVISNNAAALVLVPIALATAESLGVSPLPFIIAVMFAASNSFMTPIGYQTNTFVYGPGGYRFTDFFRVGAPLNFLLVAAASIVIPLFFPF